LTDYSRLMVAYVWYAKLMDLNNVDAVNVNEIPSVLWAGNTHRYPAREDNKCVVTAQMQSDIKDAVNWTLAHPYELP